MDELICLLMLIVIKYETSSKFGGYLAGNFETGESSELEN